MPAIQQTQPVAIAEQLKLLKARDEALWRLARVDVTPYYDQFATIENREIREARDSRYTQKMTFMLFDHCATYNLKAVKIDKHCKRFRIADDISSDEVENKERSFAENLDRFLRSDAINEAALGALTFELVLPARPSATNHRYDHAAQLAADCCV